MDEDKNLLKLKQRLLCIWEDHHQDFEKLHSDYDEVYNKMVEEKLRHGRNIFDHVLTQYPNIKFLQFNDYGDARRFLSNLSECDLIDLLEAIDDFFESVPYKELKSATGLYWDRLNRKKCSCYACISGCYQKR